MRITSSDMTLDEKLHILTDAAKYDVACTSSGVDRKGEKGHIGSASACGICHTWSSDGRCVSLLKILFTNECVYDCQYCVNCRSNDVPRATFTPDEVCRLTMEFYRRNYIEGLFLSSGIIQNPNVTMALLYETISRLRNVYGFRGYIHTKGIPGADPELVHAMGLLTDRMSVNLELPTGDGLKSLAPGKTRKSILAPMRQIQQGILHNKEELALYHHGPRFVPAGQSTQMIVGATQETDYQLIRVAESLYQRYQLKRVFYSAYIDVNHRLSDDRPPLLREHRLYQADWLMRFYGFSADELLSQEKPQFNVMLDPKCDWAVRHLELFPVEINKADYYTLLRVPGLGVNSARRIVAARRHVKLDFADIKKMGVVLKRALYFITCNGRMLYDTRIEEDYITNHLIYNEKPAQMIESDRVTYKQLSLFDMKDFQTDVNPDEKAGVIFGQL